MIELMSGVCMCPLARRCITRIIDAVAGEGADVSAEHSLEIGKRLVHKATP